MKELTQTTEWDIDLSGLPNSMMMLLMLMVLAVLSATQQTTAEASRALRAQSYTGLTDERRLNATSAVQWLNLISDPPYVGWITMSLFNDGPNSIFIGINNPGEMHEVAKGETYNVNMAGGERRIELVFYKCNAGERASARVVAKY